MSGKWDETREVRRVQKLSFILCAESEPKSEQGKADMMCQQRFKSSRPTRKKKR